MSGEYYNTMVGANGCAYTNLGRYNYDRSMAPIPAQVPSQTMAVVPSYGAGFGYQTLQHGKTTPTCSTYFPIGDAYPNFPKNCTQFTTRICNGGKQ